MKIGLIDVDNWEDVKAKRKVKFPNIPLMKISTYHKNRGDSVRWYDGSAHFDVVYKSKVFSFTDDVTEINAKKIVGGGTGYAIKLIDGKEVYDNSKDQKLPGDIEKCFPDYELYGIKDTAYGFTTRGCPRGCNFCHVEAKEGKMSYKVADVKDFWNGQKNICLCDPNIFACKDWREIIDQLAKTGAYIDFNQGVDIRTLNEEKINALLKLKVKYIHFAFDRYEDFDLIVKKMRMVSELTGWERHKVTVYILTNFDTTLDQDIERTMAVREVGFMPYIMRYDKQHIKRGSLVNALARWANFKPLWMKYETFDEYLKNERVVR